MRSPWYLLQFLCIAMLFSSCSSEPPSEQKPDRKISDQKLFNLLSKEQTGIDFVNRVKETEENNYFNNQYIYNGGGVAVGDINNDGLDDVYFTGNHTDDKLYINKGNLQFEDITISAGIKTGDDSWSTGVSFVDLNSDGWLDIYVCKAGVNLPDSLKRNQLYMNMRDSTFLHDVESNLADPSLTTQASFFDYDLDGDLDAYLINYPENFDDSQVAGDNKNVPQLDSDHLFRNDGKGSFTNVTKSSGVTNYAFGLGLITADFNGDLWPDIYVANDYIENDFLYLNNKNGTFSEQIKYSTGHNSQSSMGIDRADIDNDGYEDYFVAEMLPSDYKRSKENMASMDIPTFWYSIAQGNHFQYMHNVLQVNNQNGYYSDLSQMAGLEKTDWSWSPILEDFDNDGLVDLFVSNGILKDMLNKDAKNRRKALKKKGEDLSMNQLYQMIPSTKLSNYIYQNHGDYQFSDQTQEWGLDQRTFSNGATASDLDNDGDLDLIVNNLEDPAFIYENTASQNGNNHVAIELEWPKSPNINGLNSKIELFNNGNVLSREILPSAGYQSGRNPKAYFGLGNLSSIDSARVIWPIGTVQHFEIPEFNTTQKVIYNPDGKFSPEKSKKYFQAVNPSDFGITFKHKENKFNDFEKEILLPHRQSTLGPALTVGDINGDGLDDLVFGGASGQKARVCLQTDAGKFTELDLGRSEYETLDAAIIKHSRDHWNDIYLVNGGNEQNPKGRIDMLFANNGNLGGFVEFPRGRPMKGTLSGSCIIAEDFNGDNNVDLFVGGRAKPNAYPLADSSYLLLSENLGFKDASNWLPEMPEAGFITCAISTDFNQDGKPDLVLAGEWTPVMFYENTGSSFKDVTAQIGAPEDIGWWYSLKAADLDGNGKEEIIAGNMGENHKFRPSHETPFVIYYDDYDQNGQGDIVLANTSISGECQPVRGKQCMSEQMPFISQEKVASYNEFANTDLSQLVGTDIDKSQVKLAATMFSSSIFKPNNSGKFERESLPAEAQKSAMNAIEVIDINQDGELDLILTGNMFDTEVETTRADASTGCVLLSGKTPVKNSGLFVPGNAKKSALIDIQGTTYLIIAINNGSCQMFKILN